MNYQEVMEYLSGLARFGMKPGLERIERLLKAAGNPQLSYAHVHIAGTNGKGSVAAMVESVLRAQGYRTGLFTSPHLQRYTERMRVNGVEISDDELAEIIAEMVPEAEKMAHDPEVGAPTEFELGTAVCFEWFRRQRVDIAVVEVGLGGRYDSTNVIVPEVSVFAHIAMDHMDKLGNTIEEIAYDKAGIIKPGVPLAVGIEDPRAMQVLEREAARAGSRMTIVGRDVGLNVVSVGVGGTCCDVDAPPFGKVRLMTRLVGRHQASNCATAVAACSVLAMGRFPIETDALRAGIAAASNPGRFEVVQTEPFPVILDGAHNPDGAEALAATIEDVMPNVHPRVLVIGCSKDKRADGILDGLAPHFDVAVATAPEHTRSGAADPEVIAELAKERGLEVSKITPARKAVEAGLAIANAKPGGAVVVAGSLYLIGEVRGIWCKDS